MSVLHQADIAQLFIKAGLKSIGMVFLLTDAQVPEEEFLVVINDLLASGEVPDLFPDDEVENIINSLRNEVKGAGMQDTNENCWKFMMDRVKRQLKVVCMSDLLVACTQNEMALKQNELMPITYCTTVLSL